MPMYDRSGPNRNTLRLNRWKCLRQEIMHPGESWQPSITGYISFGALREQITEQVHLSLVVTWTPLRWLDDFINDSTRQKISGHTVDAVKEGLKSTKTLIKSSGAALFNCLGAGSNAPTNYWKGFHQNYLRVYNEHFKWPEFNDVTEATFTSTNSQFHGLPSVPLESRYTRLWKSDGVSASDYEFTTTQAGQREKIDLREFARKKELVRNEQRRHYDSVDRYRQVLKELWGVDGNKEVDQVPLVLDNLESYMHGRNIYATDGNSLGTRAGLQDFEVKYRFPFKWMAPEHGIFAYFLCIRPRYIHRNDTNHFIRTDATLDDMLADPSYYKDRPMKPVTFQDAELVTGSRVIGYEPPGQMWRTGWAHIDNQFRARNTFMLQNKYRYMNSNIEQSNDSNDDRPFLSKTLGHAIGVLEFSQISSSRVPAPFGEAIYAGV